MSGLRTKIGKTVAGCAVGLAGAVPAIALLGTGSAYAYGPTPTTQPASGAVTATTVAPATASTPQAASSSGLAFTGADLTGALGLGALAIGGGGTLVLASRARRKKSTED